MNCYSRFFCLIMFCNSAANARDIHVAVASLNDSKIQAVESAFKRFFKDDQIFVTGYSSASGIAEQPVGKEYAREGVFNRLNNLPVKNSVEYCVALENYIEECPSGAIWADYGLVAIKDLKSNEVTEALSAPVFFDATYAMRAHNSGAVQKSGYAVTVGSLIAQDFKGVNQHDWHSLSQFGGVSRTVLLEDALWKALHDKELQKIKNELCYYLDFPKPGVLFVDIFPMLKNPLTLKLCIDLLYDHYNDKNIEVVVGLESRGFLMGIFLAERLGVGFVPVRKPGKLPEKVYTHTYQKEYGTDTLTLGYSSLKQGQRVLIVDDLIATGGSARAAIDLVKQAGANPIEFLSLLRVDSLAEKAQLETVMFNLID